MFTMLRIALALFVWTSVYFAMATTANHGLLIDQYQDQLCTITSYWQIVGVCHLSGYLWIVIETTHESSYLVFEFKPDSVFSTVVESSGVHRITRLQQVWKVPENIRSDGERIKTMFALQPHQYDRSKMIGHSRNRAANGITGGIVFIFSRGVQVYDLETETMNNLKQYTFPGSVHVPLINSKDEGAILYPDDHWRFEKVTIVGNALWSASAPFLIGEGPTLNDFSWDKDKEKVLVLVHGDASEAALSASPQTAYKAVRWNGAQGYMNDFGIVHVLTEQWVYLFESPTDLPGNTSSPNENAGEQMVALRMLRLNYNDYFVCHKKTKAHVWNRIFSAMLQMEMPVAHSQSSTRYTVIFVLFGLLFFSATTILIGIVWLKLEGQNIGQLKHAKKKHYKKRTSKSHSASRRSKLETFPQATFRRRTSQSKRSSKLPTGQQSPSDVYKTKPSEPPVSRQKHSAKSFKTKRTK